MASKACSARVLLRGIFLTCAAPRAHAAAPRTFTNLPRCRGRSYICPEYVRRSGDYARRDTVRWRARYSFLPLFFSLPVPFILLYPACDRCRPRITPPTHTTRSQARHSLRIYTARRRRACCEYATRLTAVLEASSGKPAARVGWTWPFFYAYHRVFLCSLTAYGPPTYTVHSPRLSSLRLPDTAIDEACARSRRTTELNMYAYAHRGPHRRVATAARTPR